MKVYTSHFCHVLASGIFAFAEELIGHRPQALTCVGLEEELKVFHDQEIPTLTGAQPDFVAPSAASA